MSEVESGGEVGSGREWGVGGEAGRTHVEQAAEAQHGEQRVHVALAGEVEARAHVAARARHAVAVPARRTTL